MMMTMMIFPSPSLHLDPGLRLFQLAYLSVFPHWTVCFHTRPPAFGSWKIHPNIPVHILHFKISSARTVAPTKTLGVRRVIPLRRRVNRTWAECHWIGLYHWAYALPFVLLDTIVQQIYTVSKCYVSFLLQGSKLQVTMCCWPKMITKTQHLVILPFFVPRPDVPGIADTTCFHEGHGKTSLLCTKNTDTTQAIASWGSST